MITIPAKKMLTRGLDSEGLSVTSSAIPQRITNLHHYISFLSQHPFTILIPIRHGVGSYVALGLAVQIGA
jgi:hypothetical protein